MRRWLAALCLGVLTANGNAQAKSDADLTAEFRRAQALYDEHKMPEALPLFEELHAARPKNPMYEERLAMCLLGTMAGQTDQGERDKMFARAKELLLDAKKNGDDSPLLNTLLEKMEPQPGTPGPPESSPAMQDFNAAEKLFGSGDMKGAAALYEKALDKDPKFYLAALYSGDALFKSGDCPAAGTYYAKAIAIDPNHETAYRYYGDCLMKMNDMSRARDMYVDALLCQPYQKTTRGALKTWADQNHVRLLGPIVKLPNGPTKNDKGSTQITLDANGSTESNAFALSYSMSRALWQGEKFKKEFPKEKQYRHSLKEEADSIRLMLSVAKNGDEPTDTIRTLQQLDNDGMLECWILMDDADAGIAQDYAAFYLQPGHRELLHRYVVKYDLHAM